MTTNSTRHNGSFWFAAWECWLGASTIACQFTATAWGWYIQAFFSQAAMRRYIWIGQMICCLALLAYWSGVYCGSKTAAHINSCQAELALPEEPSTTYPTIVLPAPAVHEAEPTPEKNELSLISPALPTGYPELKVIAKKLGHPRPHMTSKIELIEFIQSRQS